MIRTVLLALIPSVAPVAALQTPLPRPPAPDLILINGRVITVDRNFSVAEGVGILGDRILTIGNEDQLRALAGPSTRVVDHRTSSPTSSSSTKIR
ncbi:MAG TPA: hypothetical protein VF239_14785 [Vicinamibacterales bacterium]